MKNRLLARENVRRFRRRMRRMQRAFAASRIGCPHDEMVVPERDCLRSLVSIVLTNVRDENPHFSCRRKPVMMYG